MEIEKIVCEEMAELTGLSVEELEGLREEDLFESGILDSLSLMTLLTALQTRLGITLSLKDHSVRDFSTVVRIAEVVAQAK